MNSLSLGILSSTRGSAIPALLETIKKNQLAANVNLLLSNQKDAQALQRARTEHIPSLYFDPVGLTRKTFDQTLTKLFRQFNVDFIVLIGYMRILSTEFVHDWRDRIINVHPSLLPDFAGEMNHAVHEAVLKAGVKESGCTVHQVTEEVDAGRILIQKKCPVLPDDNVDSLKARVQALEGAALAAAIELILQGKHHEPN